ncbi:MAG: hypothetical protein NC092_08720 [Butyrivibrio sp.]|nr:hypothetical protein [Muribaculum sp.]MCM1552758.1 hypothetical protein [Butyrivibrio sp.]
MNKRKTILALLCGMLGCVLMGSGDWLMMYGSTVYHGNLYWLTEGVAQIPAWRNSLSMLVAFPAVLLYGIALFTTTGFVKQEKHRRIYHYLTAFGLTPWLCLHLFYVMILFVFAWLDGNGYEAAALPAAEALCSQLMWIVVLSEALMLPPFLYWFYLQLSGRTIFPKAMAFTNVLIIYGILQLVKSAMPDTPFRIGFTNGLMSESMIVWFGIMLVWAARSMQADGTRNPQ